MRRTAGLALLAILVGALPAGAHFPMLLPSAPAMRRGEAVTVLYQWGHPFEHQLFDAPDPLSVTVVAPDGKKTDLTGSLEKVDVPAGGHKVRAHRLRFAPASRGDHVLVLQAPPLWMDQDHEFLRDTVQVVLHVQAQHGWDARPCGEVGWVPLTRPYGLPAGMVFQAQAVVGGKPLAGALVEIERLNDSPPRELPPDEQITRTARTDPNGVVTTTLPEPGWWCLTASTTGGSRMHQGKEYPVRRRLTLWVWVDERAASR
jgi:cobalt/nickel transport protein